jgi:hypothetical protein
MSTYAVSPGISARKRYQTQWPWAAETQVFILPESENFRQLNQITELNDQGLMSLSAAETASMILREIASANTVPAHISPDDDLGCCLYWVAGKSSIEFSFTGNDDIFCRVTDPDGEILVEEVLESPDYEHMKDWLQDFSRVVAQSNPNWRQSFSR